MALTEEIYIPESAERIRDDMLADLYALKKGRDPTVVVALQPGSDEFFRAQNTADTLLPVYHNIELHDRKGDPRQATGEELNKKIAAVGLPEGSASPASGKIVVTVLGGVSRTLPDLQPFILPNGKRGHTVGAHIVNQLTLAGRTVPVITDDTGDDVNAIAGTIVRFFNQPYGIGTEATVSTDDPLDGGKDAESDARKRDRLANHYAHPPAVDSPGAVIAKVEAAFPGVRKAFCYPCLGGPASRRIVVIKETSPDLDDYSRVIATTEEIQQFCDRELTDGVETSVTSATEDYTHVSIKLLLPEKRGTADDAGWENAVPWPPLEGAATYVAVSSVVSTTSIHIAAVTAREPIDGDTKIAWWSAVDQCFVVSTVVSHSGSSGDYLCDLDIPLVSKQASVTAGSFISPAAIHMTEYGEAFREAVWLLGPGENSSNAAVLEYAARVPPTSEVFASDLTIDQLEAIRKDHPEVLNAAFATATLTTPTVPATVADAPHMLRLQYFGIYAL